LELDENILGTTKSKSSHPLSNLFNRMFFENGFYFMHVAIPNGLSRILFPTLFICGVFCWNYLFLMAD
jgi:hypothetical protein